MIHVVVGNGLKMGQEWVRQSDLSIPLWNFVPTSIITSFKLRSGQSSVVHAPLDRLIKQKLQGSNHPFPILGG